MADLFQQVVAAGGIHGGDADRERKFGGGGAVRGAKQHGARRSSRQSARCRGTSATHLRQTDGDGDAQGDAALSGSLAAKCSATSIQTPPITRAQAMGWMVSGNSNAQFLDDQAKHGCGDQEGERQLDQVIAVFRHADVAAADP